MSQRPAGDRPGKAAWLGPGSLALGLFSWVIPVIGPIIALCAVGTGSASVLTRGPYRVDWTAATGIGVGLGQLFFELMLFTMHTSGL